MSNSTDKSEMLESLERDSKAIEELMRQASPGKLTPIEVLEEHRARGTISTALFIQCSLLLKRKSLADMPLTSSTLLQPEELEQLDYALAESKISPADFVKAYNGNDKPNAANMGVEIATVDDCKLFSEHIIIGSEVVPLSDVISVNYGSDSFSLNFVRMNKSSYCNVRFKSRAAIQLLEDSSYFKGSRHAAIQRFGASIADATFKSRVINFFQRLKHEGRVRLSVDFKTGILGKQPAVFVTAAGNLETEQLSINLRQAQESGELIFGVNYAALNGISKEYRPAEIAVSPTKNAWYKPMSGIVFTPTTVDTDVIHYALAWLAKPGNQIA